MADARSELEELRRLEELEARAAAAPSQTNRMVDTGTRLLRGLVTGGPAGLMAAGAGEAMVGLEKAGAAAGGAVTDTLAPHVPAEVAGALGAITHTVIPMAAGGAAGASVGRPAMEAGARRLMQSALKPDAAARAGGAHSDAAKAIQTMLDEGVLATPGGVAQLRNMVTQLNDEVMAKIKASPAVVDKGHAMRETFAALQKFRRQVNPEADMKKVLDSWHEFNRFLGDTIPVQQAQAVKQGTYKVLADKYAKHGAPAVENEASIQAQMAQARGLRKSIEDAVPGVGELNAREASLINAIEIAEKRGGVAGNRDLAGIAWLANNPKAFAAVLADRSPAFKSALAQILYKGRNTIPGTAGATAAAAEE